MGRSGCSSEGQHCTLRPLLSPTVPFTRWDSWGHCGHRWGHLLQWGLCIHQKEQGLLGVCGCGAALGKYMQTHGVQVATFVFPGVNYALQMARKSFVTQLHENRRCQVSPSVGCSPGAGRAGLSRELALEKPLHDPGLGPLCAHVCISAHLPD